MVVCDYSPQCTVCINIHSRLLIMWCNDYLLQEVFNHTVEMNVVRYIAAILDYIAADILKVYTCT